MKNTSLKRADRTGNLQLFQKTPPKNSVEISSKKKYNKIAKLINQTDDIE